MLRHRLAIVVGLIIAGFARTALAQDVPIESYDVKPVYDPVAKRYFAYMPSNPDHVQWRDGWEWVDKMAKHLVFHGVHGRLAIVDTLEVHEFLLRTFHPKYTDGPAWFGLHYLCNERQLQWSDGHFWKPGDFQAWDAQWNQDIYFCSGAAVHPGTFAPIAYEPAPNFRWIGKGSGKGYEMAFVEFPTGGP